MSSTTLPPAAPPNLGLQPLPLRSKRLLFQGVIGLLLLTILGILFISLSYSGEPMYEDFALTALLGLALGAVFYRTRFCMLCMVRDGVESRNTRPLQVLLFAIAAGSAGYLVIFGSWVPDPQAGWLPPNAFIGPVGWNLVAGGLLFGLGMAISGSCISSHVYRGAAGNGGSWIAIAASLGGFALGYLTWDFWYLRTIQEAPVIWLPQHLGYAGASAVHFGFLGLVSLVLYRVGARSRSPKVVPANSGILAFVRRVVQGRWNPWWGAAGIGLIGAAAYLRLRPLGVTSELSRAGRGLAQELGFIGQGIVRGLDAVAGCIPQEAGEFLSQNGILLITIGAGSLIACLTAGQFRFIRVSLSQAVLQILGGLLLGYGAMISLGCSIGTFLSGTMALSVSGWVFALFMTLGIVSGLALMRRQGSKAGCDVPSGPPGVALGTSPELIHQSHTTAPIFSADGLGSQGFVSPEELRNLTAGALSRKNTPLLLHVEANRIAYENGHIPGAYWFDLSWVYRHWKRKTSGGMYPEGLGDYFDPQRFGGDQPVVVYDQGDGQRACRVAIPLRVSGWSRVTVLNGGLSAWLYNEYEISEDLGVDFEDLHLSTSHIPTRPSSITPPPVRVIDIEEVKQALRREDTRIIDVRSKEEHTSGAIPSSLHREWILSLGPDSVSLAPEQALRTVWDSVIADSKKVILYCRSAIRASHSAWLLAHRYPNLQVALYDGSWREWSEKGNP